MKILAIDTSCDETSIAILKDMNVIANVFWTKSETYAKWGGVVPSIAKRQHDEFLDPAISEALKKAKCDISEIDVFAVTQGPGLAIALESGISKAKSLAKDHSKPLIAVNHMIGHIYSSLARDEKGNAFSDLNDFDFPLIALAISGGHTDMYLMTDHLKFTQLGETLDDAVGEVFDKVGRMLGMGYPAGSLIEKTALKGNPDRFNFPRPLKNHNSFNWSFSGLKTAVLYEIKKLVGDYESKPGKKVMKIEDLSSKLESKTIADLASSFQKAVIDSLLIKIEKALFEYRPKMLVVGGGVVANSALRSELERVSKEYNISVYYPKPMWLCTDNAAMIAVAANYYAKNQTYVKNINTLDRLPNLRI